MKLVPSSADHSLDLSRRHLVSHDVEVGASSRCEDYKLPIRRPCRLNVHGGIGCQALEVRAIGPNHGDVELAVCVHRERDPLSVGTPRRFEVVARSLRNGPRLIRTDALDPYIATHGVGQCRAIGVPGGVERSAGDCREHVKFDPGREPVTRDLRVGCWGGGQARQADEREDISHGAQRKAGWEEGTPHATQQAEWLVCLVGCSTLPCPSQYRRNSE